MLRRADVIPVIARIIHTHGKAGAQAASRRLERTLIADYERLVDEIEGEAVGIREARRLPEALARA